MSLYTDWTNITDNQTQKTFQAFWKEYSDAEQSIYTGLLTNGFKIEGTVKDLSEKYGVRPVFFTGFLDGVLTSLKDGCSIDVENVTEDSEVTVEIDPEKLYLNMLKADADHLYTLPAWDGVLDNAKREDITKQYKRSKIYHAVKKPGRNDPCPCGSGKKYKNCCGKNA